MRVQNERMNEHLSVKRVNTTTKCHKRDEDKYKRHSRDITTAAWATGKLFCTTEKWIKTTAKRLRATRKH